MAASTPQTHSAATVVPVKSAKSSVRSGATTRTDKTDLLECFHTSAVCSIPPTRAEPRPDTFDVLRPQPQTVLDYNISQTDMKVQAEVPCGTAKVHVQQTEATYVLPPPGFKFVKEEPPPPPPKFKYCTGRGPVWTFLEDAWKKKVEQKQKYHQEQLVRLICANKKHEQQKTKKAHALLMKLVGPEWYQELSPKQLRTVDNLKNCIVKDVKAKTIINTRDNLAELGLLLLPNHRHIKMALNQCCECPVEFLLILYQLINRHRTTYSLNDRLLLSSVVHLTMRETLKELHVRIPSPPPPLKQPKLAPKKPKRKHYKSPYLVPFTFVPEPLKHTGIYKNKHIQYPESPYFSYISELKSEVCDVVPEESPEQGEEENEDDSADPKIIPTRKQSGISDEQENEILAELKVAQREYNKLASYEPAPLLHKPSIYIPCDHGISKASLVEIKAEEKEKETESSSENETNVSISVEVRVRTDFDESAEPIRKVCECKITFDETKVAKHIEAGSSSSSSHLSGEEEGEGESVGEEQEQMSKIEELETVPGQTQTEKVVRSIAVPVDSTTEHESIKGDKHSEEQADTYEQSNAEPESVNLESINERLITVGQRESNECKCKAEVEKFIQTNVCQCERCRAERQKEQDSKKPTYIISGMKELPAEEYSEKTRAVPVVEGVKAQKTCDCLQKYEARVKMYEEMKKRFDVQQNLMTLQQKYIIGGVTKGPDGQPVYMLSGVLPNRECCCAKIYEEHLKETTRLANMPKIPHGRQKYAISGVRETEQGNVYILSGVVPVEDCNCMKMYKNFAGKHQDCLRAYEQYLKKIQIDTQEYFAELALDDRFKDVKQEAVGDGTELTSEAEGGSLEQTLESTNILDQAEQEDARDEDNICRHSTETNEASEGVQGSTGQSQDEDQTRTTGNFGPKLASNTVVQESAEKPQLRKVCQCGKDVGPELAQCGVKDTLEYETDFSVTLEIGKDKKKVCICAPQAVCICERVDPTECKCGDDGELSSKEPELQRFVILDKIPCNLSEQTEILKNALAGLANDGFPLAKLPDSYKLPHFKLWMQLRCGKYWTQEDRVDLLVQSKYYWRHTDCCSRSLRENAQLNLTREEAAKYTWARAKTVRKIAAEKENLYYRKLRQATIGDGREFFPTTFSYELPTPTFRDCYFAYTSAKEGQCLAWRPWYPHEIKRIRRS